MFLISGWDRVVILRDKEVGEISKKEKSLKGVKVEVKVLVICVRDGAENTIDFLKYLSFNLNKKNV